MGGEGDNRWAGRGREYKGERSREGGMRCAAEQGSEEQVGVKQREAG